MRMAGAGAIVDRWFVITVATESEGKCVGRRLAVRNTRLGVVEPGGLDLGWVLEGLHYYAELFGFFL